MDAHAEDMLDRLADITADLDQLQADIDYGRTHYKGNDLVQKELDAAQVDVDNTREFVKRWTRISRMKTQ